MPGSEIYFQRETIAQVQLRCVFSIYYAVFWNRFNVAVLQGQFAQSFLAGLPEFFRVDEMGTGASVCQNSGFAHLPGGCSYAAGMVNVNMCQYDVVNFPRADVEFAQRGE